MKIEWDQMQGFIFDNHPVRGQIVRLNESFQTIIEQHNYSPTITKLLAEALLSVCLLFGISKQKGRLGLQFQGEGALKLLSVRCTHDYQIRGVIQTEGEINSDDSLAKALGDGYLVLTYEPEGHSQRYQSIVEVKGHSIAEALEDYYIQSEQVATRIILAVDEQKAVGLLLQLLPEESELKQFSFEHVTTLANTLTADELLTCDNKTLLRRLYHQDQLRIFPATKLRFGCSCSVVRMENAILNLGKHEAEKILEDHATIEVTCEFCHRGYEFDRIDIDRMFKDGSHPASSIKH